MMTPLHIHFHEMESSNAVADRIRACVAKLETFFDRITSCRVTVESPHRRHTQGNHYNVRIDVVVPGKELFVGRDPDQKRSHEDLFKAVDDAFKEAERQLIDYARKHRGDTKMHGGVA